MFRRRDSAVVLDDAADAADAIAQHRAEAEARLEGKIQPLVPTTSRGSNLTTRRRGSRDSARHSRLSFVSQQFGISAVTAGCGQGLGWSMTDVASGQSEEHYVSSRGSMFRESLFREDLGEKHNYSAGRTIFPRANLGRSRFRYSMLDPSMGFAESAAHDEDDAAYSEQANYIRVMMETGNFDLQQFGLSRDAINDPNFQTALHAALESFPPGMAAQIIEAAALHDDTHMEEVDRPVSSVKKARFSIAIVSKSAWNRWSRVGSRRLSMHEKPRFASRVWSRVSWARPKNDDGYVAY